MELTAKQKGVLKGVVMGVVIALVIVVLGALANPFSFDINLDRLDRLVIALQSATIPGLFVAICVGRLAKHRFFTPEDIDGGGLSSGSQKAKILQSLLQNTLEQSMLALIVYLAWSVTMPANWMSVIPLAALAFGVGRIMFFSGYQSGASGRAIGFTLAFYPSLIMMVGIIGKMAWQLI